MNNRTPEEYKETFEAFCKEGIAEFFAGLGEAYAGLGWNPDSMIYFRNHFPRFWAMISMVVDAGLLPNKACELGSFYPYTTYYFGCQSDLFDIIPIIHPTAKPYSKDGITLHPCNLCVDSLPVGGYDLIILSEVLEHLPINLFAFCDKVEDMLVAGGHLLVSYPMHGHNAKDYGLDLGDSSTAYDEHVREFAAETVPLFFTKLTPVSERDIDYPAYGWIRLKLYRKDY